jgi:hypothetical protein
MILMGDGGYAKQQHSSKQSPRVHEVVVVKDDNGDTVAFNRKRHDPLAATADQHVIEPHRL